MNKTYVEAKLHPKQQSKTDRAECKANPPTAWLEAHGLSQADIAELRKILRTSCEKCPEKDDCIYPNDN